MSITATCSPVGINACDSELSLSPTERLLGANAGGGRGGGDASLVTCRLPNDLREGVGGVVPVFDLFLYTCVPPLDVGLAGLAVVQSLSTPSCLEASRTDKGALDSSSSNCLFRISKIERLPPSSSGVTTAGREISENKIYKHDVQAPLV